MSCGTLLTAIEYDLPFTPSDSVRSWSWRLRIAMLVRRHDMAAIIDHHQPAAALYDRFIARFVGQSKRHPVLTGCWARHLTGLLPPPAHLPLP